VTTRRLRARRCLLGLATLVGLAGCAVSDPTKYYALDRLAAGVSTRATADPKSGEAPSKKTEAAAGGVTVGVGPVIIPAYLNRPQIVTRTASDQMDFAMYHRWAEPLDEGIARILANEIAERVPTERVVSFPWRGIVARVIQYQVVVTVLRFDGHPSDDVTLDTRWRILGGDGKEIVVKRTTVTEPVAGSGYEPIVAAMARALAGLGQDIASEIRAISR